MNTPVNFEISRLLKQKGFNEETIHYRFENSTVTTPTRMGNSTKGNWNAFPTKLRISAPTITEVIMWLYKEHGIWVDCVLSRNKKQFTFLIQSLNFDADKFLNEYYNSPTEAYEAAILYILNDLI